jgi:Pup-ligase protein/WD domain, G-beta repeat
MTELLIGIETEYALVALSPREERLEQDDLMQRLMDRAVSAWPHLPARSETGIFLPNGGRLYVDTGGHLEFSTPECSSPTEVVRQVAAGDQIVLALARDVAARDPDIGEIAVLRTNVDYASGSTWGCHESYLHTVSADVLSGQLLPLLSSRVLFGAGGLDVRTPGIRFVLSPRAAFIECERSASSAIARGLLHVKDEPLAGYGYRRLHLICGESLSSEFGTYLKVGSTALAVAMIEAGLHPADGIELAEPIGALARYNGDPSLCARAVTSGGRAVRALDVQRHYLARAEAVAGRSFMPSWAAAFCTRWRAALDGLDRDPLLLEPALDWPVKQTLFAARATRAGIPWRALRQWNRVALAKARPQEPDDLGQAGDDPGRPTVEGSGPGAEGGAGSRASGGLTGHDVAWARFTRLRHTLFALDMKFGQLGPDGLVARLQKQGTYVPRLGLPWPLEVALRRAPAQGRGRLRGKAVARLAAERGQAACDWTGVVDGEGRFLDLGHPWRRRERWVPPADPGAGDVAAPGVGRSRGALAGHADRVTWVSWAPDTRLASASRDRTVRLWDAESMQCLEVLGPLEDEVTLVAWGRDGRMATLAKGMVRVWDLARGTAVAEVYAGTAAARCLSWVGVPGPGGRLAVGCGDGCIRLLTTGGSLLGLLGGHAGQVTCVAQTADGTMIASGSEHGDVAIWSGRELALLARLKGHQGAVRSIACSPDGRWLASAGDDSTVRLWDIRARAAASVLRDHRRGVSEVAFSPEGAVLASRGEDRVVRLWRPGTWAEIGSLPDEVVERWPRGLAFHPCQPWIALSGPGAAIRVWELGEGVRPATP